jgi:8-oxo-dGTP pyrophosphatase MutT (NUDIX family)
VPGPPQSPAEPVRRAARVALVDEAECVLLLSGRDPRDPTAATFWYLPGGGAEQGETLEDAARREIYEETGAEIAATGPVRWERHLSFVFDGALFDQDESFYLVRTKRFAVKAVALTPLEERSTTGWRWWPLMELLATNEVIYPAELGSLLQAWLFL